MRGAGEQVSKKRKPATTPLLGWLRDLPEVGTRLRAMANDEERMLREHARLLHEAENMLGEITVLRAKAFTAAREGWTDEEIGAAERSMRGEERAS